MAEWRGQRDETVQIGNFQQQKCEVERRSCGAGVYAAGGQPGISVSKPYGDNQPYDLVVQHGGPVQRVQMKSTFMKLAAGRGNGFQVMIARKSAQGLGYYTRREIDFLAALLGRWIYGTSFRWMKMPRTVTICFYPLGSTRQTAGRYEEYREAWDSLKG